MIDEKKLIEEIEKEIDGVIVKDTYSKGKNAGLRKARILAEEQPKIGGWIPCSDRMPEENQNVIACFAHGTVTELRFYDKKFHGIYDYDEKVIVAWQPLPEAYHE